MISIGIDPGKHTGFAIYSSVEKKLVRVETLTFWDALRAIADIPCKEIGLVVIEVPDTKHVWQKGASSPKALQRQGVNVGSVIREAELLAEGLEGAGYPVKRVKPRKKIDSATFKEWTSWTGRTNQHERDAAMLCYGRNHA